MAYLHFREYFFINKFCVQRNWNQWSNVLAQNGHYDCFTTRVILFIEYRLRSVHSRPQCVGRASAATSAACGRFGEWSQRSTPMRRPRLGRNAADYAPTLTERFDCTIKPSYPTFKTLIVFQTIKTIVQYIYK